MLSSKLRTEPVARTTQAQPPITLNLPYQLVNGPLCREAANDQSGCLTVARHVGIHKDRIAGRPRAAADHVKSHKPGRARRS